MKDHDLPHPFFEEQPAPGTRLIHRVFGPGVVEEGPGRQQGTVTIRFDAHGVKALHWDFCRNKMCPEAKPAPRLAPVMHMRCGIESPQCKLPRGYLVDLERVQSVDDWKREFREQGLVMAVPRTAPGQGIALNLPLDNFLPGRTPFVLSPICKACYEFANEKNAIERTLP